MAKVRGRRADKAAKDDPEAVKKQSLRKFQAATDGAAAATAADAADDHDDHAVAQDAAPPGTFFGLVDANEIDYFKQAEATLNIDAFESELERAGFIRSVLEEARGKELKLVTNQICSKLMERLILSASDRQLKRLFGAFAHHFASLAHHKYSSHVLETLLVRAAAVVEAELIGAEAEVEAGADEDATAAADDTAPMEFLFSAMVSELRPHTTAMVEHQYALHTLRLLILILAGKQLPATTTAHSALRSKRSKIARKMIEIKDTDVFARSFATPPGFKHELKQLASSIDTRDPERKRMRAWAIHKVALPVLQLLIQVEGLFDKERTFWHAVFASGDEPDPQELAFVEYLLSDSVGLHFLESCIKHDGARVKYIERLYRLYMRLRVLKFARRATTGVYIVQALLAKLRPAEVEYMLDQLVPELAGLILVADNQNLDLGRSVIDALVLRGNYRRDEIIAQLFSKFAPNYDYRAVAAADGDVRGAAAAAHADTTLLESTLHLAQSTLGNTRDDWPTAEERRRSLFLEKLMAYDPSFVLCVWLNFLAMPPARFVQMSAHGVFSHVIESAMVVLPQEPRHITVVRKRFLNVFEGHVAAMACNSYGLHIVDKLWDFTVGLNMYKDRIGSELMALLKQVKESMYGKMVWKNWLMELFVRKKYDWKALVKQQEEAHRAAGAAADGEAASDAKRPIDLKLEQLLREKEQREEKSRQNEEWYLKRKNRDVHPGLGDFNAEEHVKRQKVRGRNR